MIKGINRRVVVVRAPDRRFFEEAIFILRDGILNQSGVTADQVLAEAQQVADRYAKKHHRTAWYRHIPAPLYALLGAVLATLAWWGWMGLG